MLKDGLFQNKDTLLGSWVVVRPPPRTIKVVMVGQEEQDIHSGAKKQHSCQPSLLEEASLSINRNESTLT